MLLFDLLAILEALMSIEDISENIEEKPHFTKFRDFYDDRDVLPEAVQEVATTAQKEQLITILKNPGLHSRSEILNQLSENYTGQAFGDSNYVKKYEAWGNSPERVLAYGILVSDYPQLTSLSFDLGFMTHLPAFLEMAQKGEFSEIIDNPQKVREAFKEKLGMTVVWRGTSFTQDELEKIKMNGIIAPLFENLKDSNHPKEEFEGRFIATKIRRQLEEHYHREHPNWKSPFFSVTPHRELAYSVGGSFADKKEGRKFYLVKIEVPKVDVIYYTEHAAKGSSTAMERHTSMLVEGEDGKDKEIFGPDQIESFLFGKIDTNEIEIIDPESKESIWKGTSDI